jgi:hypothetical protein
MTQESWITWIVVIVIIVIVVGLGWWYFAQPAPNSTTTTTTTMSSDKQILSFSLQGLTPAVTGTIDNTADTISLTVPKGTDVTTLVPTITVSDFATVSPASGVSEDFTTPVIYTVTAQDGTTQQYTVSVTVANQ